MAMDFWKAQGKARRITLIYTTVFTIITLVMAGGLEFALRHFAPQEYSGPIPVFGAFFLILTFVIALYHYNMYRTYGGRYVAESLGAKEVLSTTEDPKERQLYNIVHEIALASSLPIPSVHIMDSNQINAFAAGLSAKTAAIAITRGALQKLKRDEIQGVIAHEFGHIRNKDMMISMRLAAMIMGFFFVIYIGLRALQFSGRRKSPAGKKGGNPVALVALLLLIAGAFSWLAGSILRSLITQQREYLADASSVQFTRNPQGLINALKKIKADHVSDMPKKGMAYAHLYFNFQSSLFATHPPLNKRIQALEGKL